MKAYLISRQPDGTVQLITQALVKGVLVEQKAVGQFDIGNASPQTKALAFAILSHYYGTDPAAQAEAQRQTQKFCDAFLIHANLPPGGSLEISDSVIDRFFSLQ